MKNTLLLSAASILLAGTAVAQGTDTCAAPTPIGLATDAFDNSSALLGSDEGPCASTYNQDLFWLFTAPADNDYIFEIDTDFDPRLGLSDACGGTCFGQVDTGGGGETLTLTGVLSGETILIQVGGWNASNSGTGTVTVSTPPAPPANDTCATAEVIAGNGTFAFDSTSGDTSDFEVANTCELASLNFFSSDVFFEWTAPADGDFQFDTNGSTGLTDSQLALYTGTCGAAVCAGNDDDGGDSLLSLMSVTGVTMGDVYLIQIGGYDGASGAGMLNITQAPDGSDCDLGIAISGNGAFAYDTTGSATTGFNGGGSCAFGASSINQDYFFVWTATADGDYNFDTLLTGYDTKMSIHTGSDCTATCTDYNDDVNFPSIPQSQITMLGVTSGDTFLVQVGGFDTNEGPGTLTVGPLVDPCDPMNEDALEDNDTCATAAPLAVGTYTDLFSTDTDTDWFSISIPAGEILTVDLTTAQNIDFNVFESDCVTSIGAITGSWNLNNTGAVALDVVFQALNADTGPCSVYDLDISIAPDPCAAAADDVFEANEDCATAAPVNDGTYAGLLVTTASEDFYSFCVADGDTVTIDLLFANADGDVDGFLRAASSVECGNGNGADELADGFTSSDNENLVWTNSTGGDLEVILQVNVFVSGGGTGCNSYDLVLTGSSLCIPTFGTMYCAANANTTGVASSIFGTGSDVAADNNFGLLATNLPDGEFGYFIGSASNGVVMNPGGSTGNLCVSGGPLARFLPTLGSILGGQIAGSIDLTDVPLPPTFSAMILAGDTFNFQLWHREGGALSGMSNFSPGLEVTFQ